MNYPNCSVAIFLDGKRYAHRSWYQIPRVGDEITLRKPPAEGKFPFKVIRVVWGVEGPDEENMGRQAVNIEVEEVK